MLIDTSILIDYLRGRADASNFLSTQVSTGVPQTSAVVAAELLTGCRDRREQREVDALLASFRLHAIEDSDCNLSLNLLRTLRLSHGIGWHDCLIDAAAIRLGIAVATLNERHFSPIPGLAVVRPY